MKKIFVNKIINLPFPLFERIFCLLRYFSAPFEEVAEDVPKVGKILDVGCGHGLFDLVLKHNSNKRVITAIDPDSSKINQAKKMEKTCSDLNFQKKTIEKISHLNKFDCIIFFDIDYLMSQLQKEELFKKAKKLLSKKGIIVVKTVIKEKSFGYYLGYLQEIVMVYLFKKTMTRQSHLNFLTIKDYRYVFKKNSLNIKKEKRLKTFLYHPHYLFILEKNENN